MMNGMIYLMNNENCITFCIGQCVIQIDNQSNSWLNFLSSSVRNRFSQITFPFIGKFIWIVLIV